MYMCNSLSATTNIKNVYVHFSRINDFIWLHNYAYASVCVVCMCTCHEHVIIKQAAYIHSFSFFLPTFNFSTLNGEHPIGKKHTKAKRKRERILHEEEEKTCIRTINCGPENMRDSNVTFNTLLKDNKNQVKRDSLQFPLTLCTCKIVETGKVAEEKKK